MAAILEISDGTTTVNLIKSQDEYGYHLVNWRPNIPFYKGGGTFQESSLAWGRHIVDKQFANPMDTFTLHANQTSQDVLIRELQELRRLLEKASYYYTTDWQNSRVWIKAKATDETNARYAVIITGTIAEDDNPFSQPFLQPGCYAVMGDLSIAIEHDLWTENAPGTGTATPLASAQAYDGRNLGNVDSDQVIEPTTTDNVYYANKGNMANISDMYIFDGVYSLNLMDAALPFGLLGPAPPAVGDILYIGVDTALANSGPFCSVVFDLSIAGAGYTAVWEYYESTGPGWVGLPTIDNTATLTVAGTNSVIWWQELSANWIPFAVNGITAYWIRLRVTANPGPLVLPVQQNRLPYSIVWPYIEIQAADVGGDVPAIDKIHIINEAAVINAGAHCYLNRLKCSLRSVSRGEDFTPYINLSDTQNHAGITITRRAGPVMTTSMIPATGRWLYAAGTGVTAEQELCWIDFGPTIVDQFYGTYHVYIRLTQGALDYGEVALRVRGLAGISSDTNYWDDTGWVDVFPGALVAGGPLFLSMGRMTIPPGDILPTGQVWDRIRLSIWLNSTISRTLGLMELVLFPVDEWSADIVPSDEDEPYPLMVTSDYFSIDSIDSPKVQPFVFAYDAADQIIGSPHTRTVGPSILQSNSRQRLYFFMTGGGVAGIAITSRSVVSAVGSVLLEKQQRYLSMRGDR